MTVLILIRHATNDFVKEGRLAGWTPGVHINAQGQREAEALARRLARVPLEAIYSSPLERAVDTAEIIAACHKLPVQVCYGLGEGRAGEWTGKLIKEVEGTDTWKALQSHPVGVKLPGGESIDEVQARMVAEAEDIVRAHPDGIVVLVSHADPLKSLIAHYLNWDLNEYQRVALQPASASILIAGEKTARLILLNHTGDLPKLEKPKREAAHAGPPGAPGEKAREAQAGSGEGTASAAAPESRKDQTKMADANVLYDLNPVSKLAVGAIGEPGHRVFYLQGRQGTLTVTLKAEKEQIASLSTSIVNLLERLPKRPAADAPGSAYDAILEEPFEPLFQIGQLGLGYDQEHDLLVIVAYQVTAEENPEQVNVVRFWGTRAQMHALAEHASTAVAGGRPICVLCGRPIDPEGHFCPRRNGHGARATLV